MHVPLIAAITTAFALTLSTTARGATIIVNSLADSGAAGICVLRDAITAADTKTTTNGCIAGTANDVINFSVTGTIALASTLPQITDTLLTINGPASPGITVSGGGFVVPFGVMVGFRNLAISNGGKAIAVEHLAPLPLACNRGAGHANSHDSTTLDEMLSALERRTGQRSGSTVVVDRGMADAANLQRINARGHHYLVAAHQPERDRWLAEFEEPGVLPR